MAAVVVSILLALAGPTRLPLADVAARFDLRGRVVDPVGGVIVGAHVTAQSVRTRDARTIVSDARGEFTLLLEAGAAIDNTVTLPGYTRADAALYVSLARGMRLQANIENVLDKTSYINADSNTNISPGSPRAVRVSHLRHDVTLSS